MSDDFTFPADHMLDNAAAAAQHYPLIDDKVLRGAVLRSVAQFVELNWACTSADLLRHLKTHPEYNP